MVFVTVGSRPYQFNRLFRELDRLVANKVITGEIFAQIGISDYIPQNFPYVDYLSPSDFDSYIKKADYVITHGASGSIMKALSSQKKVIAVTRLEKYGEHINDHQVQNNKAFGDNNYVIPVFEMSQLESAIKTIESGKDNLRPWQNTNRDAAINFIDKFIMERQHEKA